MTKVARGRGTQAAEKRGPLNVLPHLGRCLFGMTQQDEIDGPAIARPWSMVTGTIIVRLAAAGEKEGDAEAVQIRVRHCIFCNSSICCF